MRISLLIEKVEFGGIQIIGFNIANLLKLRGYDIRVAHGENIVGDFLPGIAKEPLGKMIKHIWKIPYISVFFILNLLKVLYNFKPDIIQSMGFPMGIFAGMLTYRKGIPIVVISQTRIRRGIKILNQILINKFVSKVILTSSYHKSFFPLNLNADKLSIIPNMIDINKYTNFEETKDEIKTKLNIPLGKKVLLTAGRLIKLKRVDLFLQIIKKISLIDQNIVGIVAGDGEEKKRLINLANELNIKPYIRFVGAVNNINGYLYISDLLIHTSESEIQPMILLEAGAAGIPVVCSNIGGNKTIIKDNLNGILIKSYNIEDYVNNILTLLNNSEKHKKMSEASKKIIIEKYDQRVVIPMIEKLYRSLS